MDQQATAATVRSDFHQAELQLSARLNDLLGTGRIAFAGQLHQNFIFVASAPLDGWFGQAERVDAAVNSLERLIHGGFLNLRDGAVLQGQHVAGSFARCRRDIPQISVLLLDQVAKRGNLGGIDVAH